MNEKVKSKITKFNRKNWPKWLVILTNTLFWIFLVLSVFSAILSCIFIRKEVEGRSMQPTINSHYTGTGINCDKVLINKLNKGSRGDIIVLKKVGTSTHIVKRLLAIGGDKIGFKISGDKILTYIIEKGSTKEKIIESNDYEFMLSEYNLFYALNPAEHQFTTINGVSYLSIPEDYIFYLGDNRQESQDCSYYGPVSKDLVIGKVVKIISYNQSSFKETAKYIISAIGKWFVGK